jgi:hypothetical protein
MRAAILTVVLGLALAAPATAATQSQVYRDSKDICALFSPASVAKTYNAKSPTAKAAAHAFADHSYQRPFRNSAYRGCLAGFRSRR